MECVQKYAVLVSWCTLLLTVFTVCTTVVTQEQPPQLTIVDMKPNICDLSTSPCQDVTVYTQHVTDSEKIACRAREKFNGKFTGAYNQTTTYVSGQSVRCALPVSTSSGANSGRTRALYDILISISNDGNQFSDEATLTVYNSVCYTCTKNGSCTPNIGACIKNGICYRQNTEACTYITPACGTFQVTSGYHSMSAVLVGLYSTVEDCQATCLTRITNCLAVDIVVDNVELDASSGGEASGSIQLVECWVHTSADKLLEIYADQTADQYRLWSRCPASACNDTVWTLYPNQNSFWGVPQWPAGMTVDQCLQVCLDDPQCQAVDFDHDVNDIGSPSCYSHSNDDFDTTRGSYGGVDQYVIQRCG